MIKVAILFRRAPGLTHEDCMRHWRDVHAPLVKASRIGRQYVRKFVESEILQNLPPGTPEFDGIAELWFDSQEDFGAFFADPEYAAQLGPDAGKFADMTALQIFVTEETTIM